MSVIFLSGVHGVGKGFLGAPVAKSLGIDHFTASQLIREEIGSSTWGADKRVVELDDNQSALIRAVSHRCEARQDILLDGHFVLRGSSGELVRLSKEVFSALNLAGVILLTENSETIAERLKGRDGITTNLESITELAAAELDHAHFVCRFQRIPLTVLHSPDENILTEAVSKWLSR